MASPKEGGRQILWFFRMEPDGTESAFGVERTKFKSDHEFTNFCQSFGRLFKYLPEHKVRGLSTFAGRETVIIGPRLTFETPDSSGAVEIAHRVGFPQVTRIEKFRILPVPEGQSRSEFAAETTRDRVMELIFDELPASFSVQTRPPKAKKIPLLAKGRGALERFIAESNLGFRPEQVDAIERIFLHYGKDPTDVALYQLSQMWSDHCWHILFMLTRFIINGVQMPNTLIDNLKMPYEMIKSTPIDNTEIVMSDNASATRGARTRILVPSEPWQASEYLWADVLLHILFSGETHNYPGQVAPEPGAATEIGGEIRDQAGAGRGSTVTHSICARVVGSLRFPNGYRIPGEFLPGRRYDYPGDKAEPIEVIVNGIKGWVGYANAFGVACTDFEMYSGAIWRPRVIEGKIVHERVESLKPVCFGFGAGTIRNQLKRKHKPQKGWKVYRLGGGALPIGFCGGSGSSSVTGTNTANFDENAIQRGQSEMERRMYQVILACIAMGKKCPIEVDHDQGAGGLANMTSELMGRAGGNIYLKAVTILDPTMGPVKVFVCEFQESQGVIARPERAEVLEKIAKRENCPCDAIGEITGDGIIQVYDERSQADVKRKNAEPVVRITTRDLLSKTGEFTIEDKRVKVARIPIVIPDDLTFERALRQTLKRSEVASTEWFFRLVDGSIGAHVIKGPFCGPWATPVPGCSVVALSNFSQDGQASAIGMDPFATCLDAEAGVRVSIGRMLTKLMSGGVPSVDLVKVLCNWMWPANIKPPDGEVAALYGATEAARDALISLAIALIGGKDSSSMATWVKNILIKSIMTVIFSSSVATPDYAVHLTCDIKQPGDSQLVLLDLAEGKRRLGGSSFGLSMGQLGDWAPDIEYPDALRRAFGQVYEMTKTGEAISGSHIGKGGIAAAVLRMCFAGGSGASLWTRSSYSAFAELLADELGYIVEVPNARIHEVERRLSHNEIHHCVLGATLTSPRVLMHHNGGAILNADLWDLRRDWERTSHELRKLFVNPKAAVQERRAARTHKKPVYRATFNPTSAAPRLPKKKQPWAVVVREQGSNGHTDCADALKRVGFRVVDAHMNDFPMSLDKFRLALWAPGFSYKDILGAAVGWALRIKEDPKTRACFEEFLARDDTLSWGICNGAQLGLRCGWILPDLPEEERPLFTQIGLERFNHQWVRVRVEPSPSIFLAGMEGSILGTYVANGEGYANCSAMALEQINRRHLAPLVYVDADGNPTKRLPHSPSGSQFAGFCDDKGRHLYEMPHMFDRGSLLSRWAYVPPEFRQTWNSDEGPWMRMGINAHDWCV